jgi:hypothetical protein
MVAPTVVAESKAKPDANRANANEGNTFVD